MGVNRMKGKAEGREETRLQAGGTFLFSGIYWEFGFTGCVFSLERRPHGMWYYMVPCESHSYSKESGIEVYLCTLTAAPLLDHKKLFDFSLE